MTGVLMVYSYRDIKEIILTSPKTLLCCPDECLVYCRGTVHNPESHVVVRGNSKHVVTFLIWEAN